MKKILYIGYNIHDIYDKYKNGTFDSHLLYGAIELEKMGYEISYLSHSTQKFVFKYLKDIIEIKKRKIDILFCPYINGLFYLFLYLAIKLGYLNVTIIGVLHFTPKISNANKWYIKRIYKIINKVYFHSPKNREECIKQSIVNETQTELLNWGSDLAYLDKLPKVSQKERFISTGIENRDYQTIINAFSSIDEKLNIYVFDDTNIDTISSPNIEINKIEKANNSQAYTAIKVKESICVVIPINKQGLTYCTGHTSIVEALALGIPVIVTNNEYHPIDVEKEGVGIKVDFKDVESWKNAISYIKNNPKIRLQMGEKGRFLAENRFNIEQCAIQIHRHIQTLNHNE